MRHVYGLAAVVFVLASFYCVLWIFSSASLAFPACNGEYSLFAPSFRCQQPYIAIILAFVSFGLAVVAFVACRRNPRK